MHLPSLCDVQPHSNIRMLLEDNYNFDEAFVDFGISIYMSTKAHWTGNTIEAEQLVLNALSKASKISDPRLRDLANEIGTAKVALYSGYFEIANQRYLNAMDSFKSLLDCQCLIMSDLLASLAETELLTGNLLRARHCYQLAMQIDRVLCGDYWENYQYILEQMTVLENAEMTGVPIGEVTISWDPAS